MARDNSPDLAEEFMREVVAARKQTIEDMVLNKTLATWTKLHELLSTFEAGLTGTTEQLVAMHKHYRRLRSADSADVFSDEGIYLLMLLKELRTLKKIACSDEFMRTSTGELTTWLALWREYIRKEVKDVRPRFPRFYC